MPFMMFCRELVSGSLVSNGIEEGSEIRLVPAIESGVTVSCLAIAAFLPATSCKCDIKPYMMCFS